MRLDQRERRMMEHRPLLNTPPSHRSPWYRRQRSFSPVAGLLGAVLLTQASAVPAVSADRGRQLYENQCQACHSKLVHTKEAHKINTLSDLQRRVAAWGIHAGQDWGPEETNDVTLYLDRVFYHFGEAEE